MRKLIFQQWLSLDGYAADKNGTVTFIESVAKYSDDYQLAFLDTVDTFLLGANTYRLFYEFWPTATNQAEVIADKLNSMNKVVFSGKLGSAPWGKWPAARVINTSASEAIPALKQQEGKDLVLWGSISVAQALMRDDLIDEYHFRICPMLLGSGRRMFDETPMNLDLYETRRYDTGVMLLQYRRKG